MSTPARRMYPREREIAYFQVTTGANLVHENEFDLHENKIG